MQNLIHHVMRVEGNISEGIQLVMRIMSKGMDELDLRCDHMA
jgi:hypothetical protein